jgi:hypothetical protein
MGQGFTGIGELRTRSVPDLRDLEFAGPTNALSRGLKGVAPFTQSCQDLSTVGKTADDAPVAPAANAMPTALKQIHTQDREELEDPEEPNLSDLEEIAEIMGLPISADEQDASPDPVAPARTGGPGADPSDEAEPAPANDPAVDPSADLVAVVASDPAQPSPGEKLTTQFSREVVAFLFRNRSDAAELFASWENTPSFAASIIVRNTAALYKAASDKVDADTTLTPAEKVAALAKLDAVAEKYVACIKKDGLGEKSAFGAYHAGYYDATKERQKLERQLGELSGGRTAAGAQALRAQVLDKHVYPFILNAFEEQHGVKLDITAEALVKIMLDYQAKIAVENVIATHDEISAQNKKESIRNLANGLLLLTAMPDLLREIFDAQAKAAAQAAAAAAGTPGPASVPEAEPVPEEAAETESIGDPDSVAGPNSYDEVDGKGDEVDAGAIERGTKRKADEMDGDEPDGDEPDGERDEGQDRVLISGEKPVIGSLKKPEDLPLVEPEIPYPAGQPAIGSVQFKRDATTAQPVENPMSVKNLITKFNQPGAGTLMPKYGSMVGSHGDDKAVELTWNRRTEHRFNPVRPLLNPLFFHPE